MTAFKPNRREFLKSTGALTIAFSLGGFSCYSKENPTLATRPDESEINAWLQVLEDGRIRVITGKMELGQGIKTAMRQVAAEELTLPFEQTEVQIAETGVTPNEGYTAGSRSIESSAMKVRDAAACARERLIDLAAGQWQVDPSSVRMEGGILVHGEESIGVKDLLDGQQLTGEISEPREYYGKTRREIVGSPIPRADIEKMARGEMTYVQDLRFPGMLHARVVRPPSYKARLVTAEIGEVSTFQVVRDGSFIAVVSDDEWQAIKGKKRLQDELEWEGGDELPADEDLQSYILNLPTDSQRDEQRGDPRTAIDAAADIFEATYFKPYLMHASNGPSCAVALMEENKLTVWTHSQGVYPLRSSLASMIGMAEDDIHVIGVPGSGCYGHNGADDVAAEAALVASKLPGKHIRLQWMREDEHGWEPYGTAMVMKLRAGVDSSGKITGWMYDLWSDGHSTRPRGDSGSLLPARYRENPAPAPGGGFRGGATRNAEPYYNLPDFEMNSHIFSGPLRFSALRGLGAYANIFAIESFMDELCEATGQDPVQFRINHLGDSRAIACLERLRKNISSVKPSDNQAVGIAFSRYKNSASYCAVAALVESGDTIRVKDMWAVVDSGEIINPDGLRNQIEGGMIQSASWALVEKVEFDSEHVTSLDWNSYPVLRFPDVPNISVELIDRADQPPLGAGEAAQGPATAAVVNAASRATGRRFRELPLT